MTDFATLEIGIPEDFVELLVERVLTLLGDSAGSSREWMTADEVAGYTRLSRRTIYRLTERGDLPHRRLAEGRLLYDRQEVDAWLDNQHREGVM